VAGELRAALTSIQNSADVDRMGALGSACRQDHASSPPDHVQPEEVDRYIAEMGEVAVVLGLPPKSADVSRSREGGEHQRIQDHARDGLHRQFLTLLMDREWKHWVTAGVCVTLLCLYERFGDHADEVARRVICRSTASCPSTIWAARCSNAKTREA